MIVLFCATLTTQVTGWPIQQLDSQPRFEFLSEEKTYGGKHSSVPILGDCRLSSIPHLNVVSGYILLSFPSPQPRLANDWLVEGSVVKAEALKLAFLPCQSPNTRFPSTDHTTCLDRHHSHRSKSPWSLCAFDISPYHCLKFASSCFSRSTSFCLRNGLNPKLNLHESILSRARVYQLTSHPL